MSQFIHPTQLTEVLEYLIQVGRDIPYHSLGPWPTTDPLKG